jgi:hypothetical protein
VNDPRSLILWAPCTRADCPSLGPNESVVVPYASIPGFSEETGRIDVHWWERDAGRDGLAPVEAIRTIRLDR